MLTVTRNEQMVCKLLFQVNDDEFGKYYYPSVHYWHMNL